MHAQVVVGLDFGGTKIAGAVSDLDGNLLRRAVVSTDASGGARPNLDRGIRCAQDLLASLGGPEPSAVGVATFGIPHTGGVQLAPAIPGWDEVRMEFEITRAFPGAAVRVATDVKAAAVAEATQGALAGCDPGIYLNLGTGLAVAIVAGGAVITGRNGASGE